MQLPVPSNWQEFETMTRDSLAQLWSSPTLQKNGRSGQAQQGVDIYGPDYLGRRVGIQCKRYKEALTIGDIEAEIEDAEKFGGILTALFLATTTDFDARLQQRVRILSEERVAAGKFAVGILFWGDIVSGLILNPAVLKVHYPQLQLPHDTTVDKDRRLAALELGYYGADLWEYTQLMLGEAGWLAHTDPDELFATLRIIEHRAQQLFAPKDASPIIDALTQLNGELRPSSGGPPNWALIEQLAKRISKRCLTNSSLLPVDESNALDIAAQLGRIFHHYDDRPSQATQESVKRKVMSLLGASSQANIDQAFQEAQNLTIGYSWAIRIFGLLNREIRFG